MPRQVVNQARIACSLGSKPSQLVVLPVRGCSAGGQPAATIADHVPIANIPPFGVCSSLAFPPTAAATAAAQGVLTPMPCAPKTAPWSPGSTGVTIRQLPALRQTDTCKCAFGGVISVSDPGQAAVDVR